MKALHSQEALRIPIPRTPIHTERVAFAEASKHEQRIPWRECGMGSRAMTSLWLGKRLHLDPCVAEHLLSIKQWGPSPRGEQEELQMGSDLPKGAWSRSILTWTERADVSDVAHKTSCSDAALGSVMLQWFDSTEVRAERLYTKALFPPCAGRQETEELMMEEEGWRTQRRIQLQAD